eukprot:7126892-Prymnesium_polylepis.1
MEKTAIHNLGLCASWAWGLGAAGRGAGPRRIWQKGHTATVHPDTPLTPCSVRILYTYPTSVQDT